MEQNITSQELITVLRGLKSDDERYYFFLSACANNNLKICQVCLDAGIDINIKESFHKTPLLVCLMENGVLTVEVADWLLKNGGDINLTDIGEFSSLTYACYKGDYSFAKYFVEKGATIRTYKNTKNASDLYYAVNSDYHDGSLSIVSLLLENGADLETEISDPRHPFMSAVQLKRADIVELFLHYGANPNFYHYGRTPLHVAVANKDLKTAEVLLKNGANPNLKAQASSGIIKTFLAITVMDIAVYNEDEEMQKLLASFCGFPSTKEEKIEILMACSSNSELKTLLKKVWEI